MEIFSPDHFLRLLWNCVILIPWHDLAAWLSFNPLYLSAPRWAIWNTKCFFTERVLVFLNLVKEKLPRLHPPNQLLDSVFRWVGLLISLSFDKLLVFWPTFWKKRGKCYNQKLLLENSNRQLNYLFRLSYANLLVGLYDAGHDKLALVRKTIFAIQNVGWRGPPVGDAQLISQQ